MKYCDCCMKQRKDVISCGRDYNGGRDAPDMCFLCRVEYKRGRTFSAVKNKYVTLGYHFEYED